MVLIFNMIKNFDEYIKESWIGAITMDRKPIDKLNQPDTKVRTSPINMGRGGPGRGHSLPYHWGSTALSFGSNPKKNKKKMSKNHVDNFQKFTKKEDKKIEEDNGMVILNAPEQFKAEQEVINRLKDEITNMEQTIAAKKVDLNNKVKELQNKIASTNKHVEPTAQQQPMQPIQ